MHKYGARVCRLPSTVRTRVEIRRLSSALSTRQDLSILAIETSCDDSSVAILNLKRDESNGSNGAWKSQVVFHETVTAQTEQYNGIHPIVALTSHHSELSKLVQRAVQSQKRVDPKWTRPSLVAATRGPGMRSNLAVGLSVAKGLAVAWDTPLIGVHHMQAHALTPRLCWTLEQDGKVSDSSEKTWSEPDLEPRFPYLSVLVSGGHTMLLDSRSLTEHRILASTADIALGDCLDKAARVIVPAEMYKPPYGKALEEFAFPSGTADYKYTPPKNREEEIRMRDTPHRWALRPPLQESREMRYTYAGFLTQVVRIMRPEDYEPSKPANETGRTSEMITIGERRYMAREVLRICFEHLASRILLHLENSKAAEEISTIVVSGGVASNKFLRHMLREMLNVRGYHINLIFPPVKLCTDNALMIAWAGAEMYMQGYTTDLGVEPLRKWSMDSTSTSNDGGILGAPGWIKSSS